MQEFIHMAVEYISFGIGAMGIFVIMIGSIVGTWEYLTHKGGTLQCFSRARLTLGSHLVLGLDFLVGKDVIDTFLLGTRGNFIVELLTIITVVGVRIVLNHYLLKELEELRKEK